MSRHIQNAIVLLFCCFFLFLLRSAWHLSDSESKRILSGKAMRYTEAGQELKKLFPKVFENSNLPVRSWVKKVEDGKSTEPTWCNLGGGGCFSCKCCRSGAPGWCKALTILSLADLFVDQFVTGTTVVPLDVLR